MDYVQALFSFFIAPLFGPVLLECWWEAAITAAAIWGLQTGYAVFHREVGVVKNDPARWPTSLFRQGQTWREHVPALCPAGVRDCDVVVSLLTKPKPERAAPVWFRAVRRCPVRHLPLYKRPIFWRRWWLWYLSSANFSRLVANMSRTMTNWNRRRKSRTSRITMRKTAGGDDRRPEGGLLRGVCHTRRSPSAARSSRGRGQGLRGMYRKSAAANDGIIVTLPIRADGRSPKRSHGQPQCSAADPGHNPIRRKRPSPPARQHLRKMIPATT